MISRKKILITGCCGHIGSFLIDRNKTFLSTDYDIVGVDDLSTQRYCSLFNQFEKIKFINKSFSELNLQDLKEVYCVIHLAAITNAAESFDKKELIEEVNYEYTKKFVDLVEESDVEIFIFPSSTSVYGVASNKVLEDDDKFLNPQSPYADSKIMIEKYIQNTMKKVGYSILRLGTIFGISKGMRFHTAINKFCWQSSLNQPLTIWKQNFHHVRPYLGLKDFSSVVEKILLKEEMRNQIFNVVSENVSLKQIVELIKLYSRKEIKLNFIDTPLLNQYSYEVSTEKIEEYGIIFQETVSNGIRDTMEILKGIK